jgi:hypothetical protein
MRRKLSLKCYKEENTWRYRHRLMHNIEMGLTEIGGEGVTWIEVAQNREEWHALVEIKTNTRIHNR